MSRVVTMSPKWYCPTCRAEHLNVPKHLIEEHAAKRERAVRILQLKNRVLFWLAMTILGGAVCWSLGHVWFQG